MPPSNQTCSLCNAYQPRNSGTGFCLAHPPVRVGSGQAAFPTVPDAGWCREWAGTGTGAPMIRPPDPGPTAVPGLTKVETAPPAATPARPKLPRTQGGAVGVAQVTGVPPGPPNATARTLPASPVVD